MLSKFVVEGRPVGKDRPRFTRSGHAYPAKKNQDLEKAVFYLNWIIEHGKAKRLGA